MFDHAQEERVIRVSENHLLCPITQDLMVDPVIADDDVTYERAAIARWQADKGTSPYSRDPISNVFRSNIIVRNLVAEYNAAMKAAQNVGVNVDARAQAEPKIEQAVVESQNSPYSDWLSKLGQSLLIPNKEIWYGWIVEQTLVALADIHTSQEGASIDKENSNGVSFQLKFSNSAEYQHFIMHYRSKYTGSILQTGDFQAGAFTKVVMDMKSMYGVITPALGEFRKAHSLPNVMQSLAKTLNVDYKEVDIGGDAVERRLVAKAGITTSQKDAWYMKVDYCTAFHLAFASKQEHDMFLNYYNTNFPYFIIRHGAYEEGGLSRVEVSSRLLLAKVAPTLDNSLDIGGTSDCRLF
jgi:hypothetical protein